MSEDYYFVRLSNGVSVYVLASDWRVIRDFDLSPDSVAFLCFYPRHFCYGLDSICTFFLDDVDLVICKGQEVYSK